MEGVPLPVKDDLVAVAPGRGPGNLKVGLAFLVQVYGQGKDNQPGPGGHQQPHVAP